MEDFNPMNSLKLANYLNVQMQNLSMEDADYIDTVNLGNLMLESEYQMVQKEVERYNYLKNAIENRTSEIDIVLASDEMKRLRNDIFTQIGQDANLVDLSKLDTAAKIENILQNSGIVSQNNLTVKFEEGPYYEGSYARMELTDTPYYMRYGIKTGSRMAISKSGKILVPKASLYSK